MGAFSAVSVRQLIVTALRYNKEGLQKCRNRKLSQLPPGYNVGKTG
jgi:hypothetical protein